MAQAFVTIMRHGWGDERLAFMQAFSSVFFPNGSPEQIKWLVDLQRHQLGRERRANCMVCDDIDVVDPLPKVQVPTLVLHRRHDNVAPFERGGSPARYRTPSSSRSKASITWCWRTSRPGPSRSARSRRSGGEAISAQLP
jgi:hypothetical protein